MSRRCDLTGKGVMSGNNVSHAVNKTRRRFLPNIHRTQIHSDILNESVSLRVSTRAMRTIDIKGGLDAWLLGTANYKLTSDALTLKRRIQKKEQAAKNA